MTQIIGEVKEDVLHEDASQEDALQEDLQAIDKVIKTNEDSSTPYFHGNITPVTVRETSHRDSQGFQEVPSVDSCDNLEV